MVRGLKLCSAHLQQWKKHGETWPLGTRRNRAGGSKGRRPKLVIVEEVEFLLPDTAEHVAARLGYRQKDHLYQALRRAERLDLWQKLTREAA